MKFVVFINFVCLCSPSHFTVKVMVFLTMPIDPASHDIPQQIELLWGVKSSITYSDAVPVIMSLLESPLENLAW